MTSSAGDIDVSSIAELTKQSEQDVTKALIEQDLGYVTPNGSWQTKEKYINGNIAAKLDEAQNALEYGNNDMQRNIKALNAVLPERVPMNAVTIGFGASWIETDIYRDFIIQELYGKDVNEWLKGRITESQAVQVSMAGGICSVHVDIKALPAGHNARSKKWHISVGETAAQDITFNKVLAAALGNKEIVVNNKTKEGGQVVVTFNEEATGLANSMVQTLLDDWQEFIRTGPHREHLSDSYNYRFNSFYTPKFDGSHMTFPGMRAEIEEKEFRLREHQRNAVYKGLMQGRGLFAHEVGTGKTYVMGALAMESKRLGLAKKTLLLAKTANYKAVAEDIQKEYPGAKILVIGEKGDKAGGELAEAMIGDWDIIVAPHSQVGLFMLSDEAYTKAEQNVRQEIREQLEQASSNVTIPPAIWDLVDGKLESTDKDVKTAIRRLRGDSLEVKELVQSLTRQLSLLEKYGASVAAAKHIPFEDLGIDQVLVDEAHEFKKPGLITRSSVKGIETSASDMALKLRMLVENVQERFGRGVYLFTGTPITNTATELYQMMRYVMKPEMEAAGIASFDSWFATYAQADSALSKKPTGEYEDEVRFIGFKNLPELKRMYDMYFDFVKANEMPEFTARKVKGYALTDENIPDDVKDELENGRTEDATDVPYHRIVNVRSETTEEMNAYTKRIEKAAKRYAEASGAVKKQLSQLGYEGEPLTAMRKLSQLGLDPRLVGGADYAGSKIQNCADNILQEYQFHDKVSQAVFLQEGVSDERSVVERGSDGFAVRDENGKVQKVKVAGWNVAQALKDELVNRGIPEDEIVVLSSDAGALAQLKKEYKRKYKLSKQPTTDDLKKLIAEEVSECKVKVVIGTRSMLGTGINMQHNLKAIHQLDAPWMPGELAQSQGRAVRQKNQWNTVTEYRYLTDLDVVRWNRLAIKSSFINAITDKNSTQRTLEMDESMGSSIGGAEGDIYLTLSAAAQDNRLMEQNRLDKKVKKLEAAQKVFYRSKELQEAEAKRAEKDIDQHKKDLQSLKKLDAIKNDDQLVIEGRKDDEKEVDAIRRLESDMRKKGSDKVKLATYRGLTISGKKVNFSIELYISNGKTEAHLKTIEGSISASSLRALINNELPKQIKGRENMIANDQRAIDTWETEKDAKFTGEEALNKARARRDAIIEDIKRNPEKPPLWLVQQVPPNSTVRINGETTIIRSYFVGKNKDGEKVHYLIDDMGDAYHISQIRDYQTGLNPYEDFLKDEPKDIKPVKDVQEETTEETTEETAEETQDGQDEVKYSTVEEDETHEKTDEEWREEALAASKEKLDKDQARWAKQVDTFLQKPAEAVEESEKPLFIMDSPVLFDLFGVERLPVYIEEMTLHKIIHGAHVGQGLTEALKRLPFELARPAAVVLNRKGGKRGRNFSVEKEVLIFTSYHVNNEPVNIAFKFNRAGEGYKAEAMTKSAWKKAVRRKRKNANKNRNRIPEYYGSRVKSLFARQSVSRFTEPIADNELLYWDTKKGASLFAAANLSPQSYNTTRSFNSIAKDESSVNATQENEDSSLERMKRVADERLSNGEKNVTGKRIYTPQDLEEHIVNAYRNRNEVRYSNATSESETHKYSESEVQEAFKGQNVTRTDNGYEITFNNGNKLVITETGEMRRPDGRRIRGSYRKGEITLTDMANPFTLGHEKLHFAKDCLYTPKEWAFIEKATRKRLAKEGNTNPTALEIEERAADWYAEWEHKRSKPSGTLQKLFTMLHDFLAKVANLVHGNANAQFSKLREGKLYGRNWTDNKGKRLKYSTVQETNDAIVRTSEDIREDSAGLLSEFTKGMNNALVKRGMKAGKGVHVRDDIQAFNWMSHTLMTPDHLAKHNETLRVFTSLGKDSSRELQRLRDEVDEQIEAIGKNLDTDERRNVYNNIIEQGELDGVEFTADELRKENVEQPVIDAYLATRKLYDDYYRKVDETKRNMTPYHRIVTAKELQALKDNTFVEGLDSRKLASGKYEVKYRIAQQYVHTGEEMTGKKLQGLLQSRYAKVTEITDETGARVDREDVTADGIYQVNYTSIDEPMHKVKGYFHHMFEDWSVYEKTTDPAGIEHITQVASYRSRTDAVTAFNKMQDLLDKSRKENKTYTRDELKKQGYDNGVITAYEEAMQSDVPVDSREYVIRPKTFRVPGNGGVALSNLKYEQAIRAIEDKYEVSSQEAREMAKGILKKKAGHRFFGAAMERTGEKGYSLDMLHVLRMYTMQATRYVALEKFKNNAYREFEKLFGVPVDESKGGGLEFYIKKYIDDVNGNPTRIEQLFNETLNNFFNSKWANVLLLGVPKYMGRALGADRPAMMIANKEMTYAAVLKLGLLNVSSAAINLTQLMNSVTILGVKPLIKAHWAKGNFTEEEVKFLKDVGVDTQLGLEAGAGYDKNRSDKIASYALAAFTWSEQKVRQITALMAFDKAKREGMSYAQAVKLARDINDEANFDYGINNAPLFIRAGGPVTQMLFQFMKFPVNQLSFMMNTVRHGTNAQRARLMIPLLMSGAYGIPGWAAVVCPFLAAVVAAASGDDYDDPELYLKKKCYLWADGDPFWIGFLQVGFHGLPALANLDIGRRIGIGDFGGDVSKTLRGQKYGYDMGDFMTSLVGGIVLQSTLQSLKQLSYGNEIEAVKALSPALGNIAQAIVGERKTTRGRLATKYDGAGTRTMKALGFKPLDETVETEKARMIQEERSIKKMGDTRLIDEFIRAKEDGDKERMNELTAELKKRGISAKRVNNEIKRKKQSQFERAIDNEGSKKRRQAAQERFNW